MFVLNEAAIVFAENGADRAPSSRAESVARDRWRASGKFEKTSLPNPEHVLASGKRASWKALRCFRRETQYDNLHVAKSVQVACVQVGNVVLPLLLEHGGTTLIYFLLLDDQRQFLSYHVAYSETTPSDP